MFRVCAVSVLTLGLLIAASTQAQQPGPYLDGPMPLPAVGYGPQAMSPQGVPYGAPPQYSAAGPQAAPQGMPQDLDPAYAQAMYDPAMASPYGPQYQSQVGAPVGPDGSMGGPMMGGPMMGGPMGGDCGCGGGFDGGYGGCGCGPCQPCFQPCCEPCPPPGCPVVCSAEIEMLIMHPEINNNIADGTLASPTVPALATFSSLDAQFDDEVFVSPRMYLHTQKCEWGLGLRFYNLDESEFDFSPLSQLQLNILGDYYGERYLLWYTDAEVTYTWRNHKHQWGLLNDTWFQLSVGLRYAEMEHDALALGTAVLDDVLATTTAVARSEYEGCGLTTGFRGTKGLFGNLSGYWSLRGSFLNGDLGLRTQTTAHAVGIGDAAGAVTTAGALTQDELFISEFALGVQWQHDLRCLPARYFFRVAAEYQTFNFNSPAFATSTVQVDVATVPGTIATAQANALAIAPDIDMFGIVFGTGLVW